MRSASAGLAGWSVRHPVAVCMLSLAAIVLGLLAIGRLSVDLLPHIIYPEIRVRVVNSGVSSTVMEDQVTRQLEEQLAITEDAVRIQSVTSEGSSSVDLIFDYGKDIDIALRDASTRLDRAKRFLPDGIDPPTIYKRDPSQIPALEWVVSSTLRDGAELRSWTDHIFSKWFVTLPGVAAAEVGGGLEREIHIQPDQNRLAGLGLDMNRLIKAISEGNQDASAGRLNMASQQITGKISARVGSLKALSNLPVKLPDGSALPLSDLVKIIDTHQDQRIRIRANGVPGVKLSIQKQPSANTVEVVDRVNERIRWLQQQKLIPEDISLAVVSDQSIYIRQSLNSSAVAVVSGALLAMLVVYLFLGSLKRTLIIGSAIPIAVMVAFVLMGAAELTLNVMTLGGLALGVGMLVDNTIVMLENIYRHQLQGENSLDAAEAAAAEVNGAIVASTSTNLAAVLPFLFISGLVGLLFQELIFTISASIIASMVIALTLVPALAARVGRVTGRSRSCLIHHFIDRLQERYVRLIRVVMNHQKTVMLLSILLLGLSVLPFLSGKQEFLPKLDDGQIRVALLADPGISLDQMDERVSRIESMLMDQPDVETVFTLSGGFVFGRSQRETPNRATISVQLKPLAQRQRSSAQWMKFARAEIEKMQLAGLTVRVSQRGIRGIRTSSGEDDISLKIQGDDLEQLNRLAAELSGKLKKVSGLRNLAYSSEEVTQELKINIDRERAVQFGYSIPEISRALKIALDGVVVSDYLEGDRSYAIRLRLPPEELRHPEDLSSLLLFPASGSRPAVYLGTIASIGLEATPATIQRDNQLRVVEVSATLVGGFSLAAVLDEIERVSSDVVLPSGYSIYEGGARAALEEGQRLSRILLGLALFLVFVVMAIQYESLLNPLVIMLTVPFTMVGVGLGIYLLDMTLSMPVWLGMIMLAGIVVNNAIVLVEYIEISRKQGLNLLSSIEQAARLRLRPVLMTTLTTVIGMLPLALGWGEGAEMLQPLALVIVWGLSISTLFVLLLVPLLYSFLRSERLQNRS